MREKKILIDLLNLSTSEIAGVGVFTRNLLEKWLADKISYEVHCYSVSDVDVERLFRFSRSNNIHIHRVSIKHVLLRFLYQQFILPFVLRGYKVYYNPAVGLPYLATVFAPRTRLVCTIHDMIPFYFPKKYSRIRGILMKLMSKYAARVAHHVVTVSSNSKKDIVEIAGVSPDKISIVYNFPSHQPTFDNFTDHEYFLTISTLEPGKNVENTIAAFSRFLKSTGSRYKFYWIGRLGWVYTDEYLQALIKSENLQDSFILTGYVDENQKQEYLAKCSAIVYMSHYEGFGLPVLEGMTFNKPCVVSNNSSLPEVVGDAGILCDPLDVSSIAEALKQVIAQRDTLIRRIPKQVQRFDPSEQVRKFKLLIDSLLAN